MYKLNIAIDNPDRPDYLFSARGLTHEVSHENILMKDDKGNCFTLDITDVKALRMILDKAAEMMPKIPAKKTK